MNDTWGVWMTPERKQFFLYLMAYAMTASAIIRTLLVPCPPWLPTYCLYGTMAAFSGFMIASNIFLKKKHRLWIHVYLSVQTLIAVGLIVMVEKETPALMHFALAVQALTLLPLRQGGTWLGVLISTNIGMMMYVYGSLIGLGVAPLYVSGFLFMGLFTYLLDEQEKANAQNQQFLLELREAYQKLQSSSAQAEELAVTKERNRIARELHDSVTQMLFSMNLMAQTTKVLAEREAPSLVSQLEPLQNLTQDALSEMRYLLFQLRPGPEAERGLLPAIRQHIHHLQARHPLEVSLEADEEPPLSSDQAHKLFRITQEALNNVVKHAQTDSATVSLEVEEEQVTLSIEDQGVGCAPEEEAQEEASYGKMGLSSMRERADLLGASFHFSSLPGKGTQIQVTLPMNDVSQSA